MIHQHGCYGLFPGGDPRRFTPDTESNSPEEIAKHKAACEAWDAAEKKGKTNEPVEGATVAQIGDGLAILCGISGFGIGVYMYDCDDPECPEAREPIDPADENAQFARWLDWDAQIDLGEIKEDERERLRTAFLAGFRAAPRDAAEDA